MNTNHSSIIIIFTVLISSALLPLPASARCNKDDEKALIKFRDALGGLSTFPTWDPKLIPCCEWGGQDSCDNGGRVTSLDISLSAKVPPKELTKLRRLRFLTVKFANLSGPVPDFLGEMTNLESLDLSFNSLSGSIPPSLGALTKLGGLRLDRNRLTGPIPDSLGRLTQLTFLYLSHNMLTGEVPPTTFGGLIMISTMDLSRNRLVGDPSKALFGESRPTFTLLLSRNLFEFDLTKVGLPQSVSTLDLSHNMIYGGIPEGVAGLKQLQAFNVSYNRLCGEIPTGDQGMLDSTYTPKWIQACATPPSQSDIHRINDE
ncbi:Polygalacturonase inhibitor 1 [Acorus calamus]|uniref:Polygalacturonase inhibitor 1 n=1 Tax=Acorus calamus TaxID=4465 RepID=A0AAV9EHW1_ACOCL|nr:Polygalacturonase inhibitor 1 [Acorus calamus]